LLVLENLLLKKLKLLRKPFGGNLITAIDGEYHPDIAGGIWRLPNLVIVTSKIEL
jgi:hypothetical protein